MTIALTLLVVGLVLGRLAMLRAHATPPADVSPYADTPPVRPMSRRSFVVLAGLAAVTLVAAAGALAVRPRTYFVPSGSMAPTLEIGDRVLVTEGEVERGTIVIFRGGDRWSNVRSAEFVKRVIGVPGDTVESRDGVLYVNGERYDEPYLAEDGEAQNAFDPVTVPDDAYFVLGDNRNSSNDSRYSGFVRAENVRYVVRAVVFPLGRAGWID